jgi:hypothetical protein
MSTFDSLPMPAPKLWQELASASARLLSANPTHPLINVILVRSCQICERADSLLWYRWVALVTAGKAATDPGDTMSAPWT